MRMACWLTVNRAKHGIQNPSLKGAVVEAHVSQIVVTGGGGGGDAITVGTKTPAGSLQALQSPPSGCFFRFFWQRRQEKAGADCVELRRCPVVFFASVFSFLHFAAVAEHVPVLQCTKLHESQLTRQEEHMIARQY